MEYGLRRYEAVQRLIWFAFFLFCLCAAHFTQPARYSGPENPQLKNLKNIEFWTGLHGILMAPPQLNPSRESRPGANTQGLGPDTLNEPSSSAGRQGVAPVVRRQDEKRIPAAATGRSSQVARVPGSAPGPDDGEPSHTGPRDLGGIMQILVRAAVIFLIGRCAWLVLQYVGKFLLKVIMEEKIKGPGQVKAKYSTAPVPVSFFPRQLLLDEIRHFRFSFLFQSFWRLRLMLSGFQKSISSEELIEKERRIVDSDWEILHSSWGPYRWIFRALPVLALAQTGWFLLLQLQSVSLAQKEVLDIIQSASNSLLPLAQAAGLVVFFTIAAGLLKRMEELYLSNLDALIFDRLLSKLPFQSNDTLIILETLQRQFRDMNAVLKRIERAVHPDKKTGGPS